MFDLQDPRQAYEQFRLEWMIQHGFTILDFVNQMESMLEEDFLESDFRTCLQDLFADWEFGVGFHGAIWPSYPEFLANDYPVMLKSIQYKDTKENHHV